ncbi:MAG: LysE family translocator [Bacteroidales bacterium]|nr:LysE family translocator [Bacteroidales bacterium]
MQIFHIITQGILFGLTLSFMVGPAFFSLLQTSISKGFRSGSHLATGVAMSDVVMVFVAWYGLSTIFESGEARKIFSIVGGIVIVVFGLYTATRRHVTPKARQMVSDKTHHLKHFGQGFLFNIANPGTWLYWLIPVGVANSYTKSFEQIIFLIAILSTNLGMDLLKCAIANELKRFLTDNVITIINRVVGVILVVFGVYLAVSMFFPEQLQINGIHQ